MPHFLDVDFISMNKFGQQNLRSEMCNIQLQVLSFFCFQEPGSEYLYRRAILVLHIED